MKIWTGNINKTIVMYRHYFQIEYETCLKLNKRLIINEKLNSVLLESFYVLNSRHYETLVTMMTWF